MRIVKRYSTLKKMRKMKKKMKMEEEIVFRIINIISLKIYIYMTMIVERRGLLRKRQKMMFRFRIK